MADPTHDTSHTSMPAPRRTVWKTVAMSTVLLLCGVFIGSGLTLMALKRRVDEFRSRPDLLSQRMLDRMKTDLELTDSQSEEIRKIFTEARREAGQMRERNRAQTQAFFREFQGDVAQVLTPSQQSEWEEWFRRARSRAMKEHRDGSHDDKREVQPASIITFNRPEITQKVEEEYARVAATLDVQVVTGDDGNVQGITTDNIEQYDVARELGFKNGDVLVSINNEPVRSREDAVNVVKKYRNASLFRIGVLRGGQMQYITYRMR